jgi:sulfonate transport system permease protein
MSVDNALRDVAPPAIPAAAVGPAAGAARGRRGRRRGGWRRAVSPVLLVVGWQLASSTGLLPRRKLAAPVAVARTGWDLIRDGTLGSALATSLHRVLLGLALGVGTGLVLALVSGLSRWGQDAVDPLLQMLRAVPIFGLIPLFILWFGIGETPKVLLIALGAAFPIYLNGSAAIRGTDGRLLELAASLRLSRRDRVWHVILPEALPPLLVGLRQSLGVAWLALIVAEQINADKGLGYLINNAREFLRTDVIVVGLTVYALLGLVTDAIVRFVERHALAWRTAGSVR